MRGREEDKEGGERERGERTGQYSQANATGLRKVRMPCRALQKKQMSGFIACSHNYHSLTDINGADESNIGCFVPASCSISADVEKDLQITALV